MIGRLAAVAAATAVLFAPAASAQDAGGVPSSGLVFGIKPAKFGETTLEDGHLSYSVPAGSRIEDAVTLINYSDRPINISLYPADLRSARGGAVAPLQESDEMQGVGDWVALSDPELATVGIAPRSRRTVSFVLHVPAGTAPGDYPGAMVAALDLRRDATGIAVQARAALVLRVRVPGTIALGVDPGEIGIRRSPEGYRIDLPVRNTGNVLFHVEGEVELRRGGERIGTLALGPRTVYVIPGGRTDLSALWRDPPRFGRIRAIAHVTATVDGRPSRTYESATTLTLVPWLSLALVFGCLAVVAGVLVATRHRRRAWVARRREERELLRRYREQVKTSGPSTVTLDGGRGMAARRTR